MRRLPRSPASLDGGRGTTLPPVELDARRLLAEIARFLPMAPGRVGPDEIWQMGAFLARFAHQHGDVFGEHALERLCGEQMTRADAVSLPVAKGCYHLAHRQEPELWLSLFEFAGGEPTTIHDHATWGVMLALGGRNHVRLFERSAGADEAHVRVDAVQEWTLKRGGLTWWFDPPRNIHQQEALGDTSAYGLVLMGHDPTTRSRQSQYDLETGRARLVPYRSGATRSLPALVRRIAAKDAAPHAARVDRERRFPREAFEALAREGLLSLMVPVEHGGMGGGSTSVVEACETLAKACACTGLCFLMHCCGSAAIASRANEIQRRRYLARFVRGEAVATITFGGGDDASAELTVRRHRDGVRLSGRRPFVTSGDRVDFVLVLAEGSMYVVETAVSGVCFEGHWDGLGMAGNNSTTLILDDVPLPRESLLGDPGGGAALRLEVVRPLFLLGVAAVNLGIASAALNDALESARSRRDVDGRRRGDTPAIQLDLAEMRSRLDAARAIVHAAAAKTHEHEPDAELFAMAAKLLACEASIEVTQRAMQVCGGHGYSGVSPVERHLRDAHTGRLMTPTADQMKAAIGRGLVDAW